MHLVLGFRGDTLAQAVAFPFANDLLAGGLAGLDDAAFDDFAALLAHRSDIREGAYFSDPKARELLEEQVANFSLETLFKLRPRHFSYALGIVWTQSPFLLVGGLAVVSGLVAAIVLVRRQRARRDG